MVCCIQGFVVKDAITLEFVWVVPIAKVRCIQGFVVMDAITLEFVRVVPIVKVRCIQGSMYLSVSYEHGSAATTNVCNL